MQLAQRFAQQQTEETQRQRQATQDIAAQQRVLRQQQQDFARRQEQARQELQERHQQQQHHHQQKQQQQLEEQQQDTARANEPWMASPPQPPVAQGFAHTTPQSAATGPERDAIFASARKASGAVGEEQFLGNVLTLTQQIDGYVKRCEAAQDQWATKRQGLDAEREGCTGASSTTGGAPSRYPIPTLQADATRAGSAADIRRLILDEVAAAGSPETGSSQAASDHWSPQPAAPVRPEPPRSVLGAAASPAACPVRAVLFFVHLVFLHVLLSRDVICACVCAVGAAARGTVSRGMRARAGGRGHGTGAEPAGTRRFADGRVGEEPKVCVSRPGWPIRLRSHVHGRSLTPLGPGGTGCGRS